MTGNYSSKGKPNAIMYLVSHSSPFFRGGAGGGVNQHKAMKINKLFILSLTAFGLTLSGCEKPFDELELDPNRPTSAPASLVFSGVLNDMYNAVAGNNGGAWNENTTLRISFTPVTTITTQPTTTPGHRRGLTSRP